MDFEIQAHRGNDQLTLRRLLAAHPSSVELDVGVTASGALVVAHDTDHGDDAGLTLDRALAAAGQTTIVVEAKCFPGATPDAAAFVAALGPYLGGVRLCSFDARVCALARAAVPGLETTFLVKTAGTIGIEKTLGPRHDVVTRELVEAAHAAGKRVVPWTVNDVREMSALVDLGVDGLVTDEPALARAVVESRLAIAA